jgi:hypothetical protein
MNKIKPSIIIVPFVNLKECALQKNSLNVKNEKCKFFNVPLYF